MSSPPDPRCTRHGLAFGPDGRCVLCKRAEVALAAPPDIQVTVPWAPLLFWALALAGAGAFWSFRAPGRSAMIQLAPLTVPQWVEPDPLVLEPRTKTPEEQVADAERARLLREQAAAKDEPQSPQPMAAEERRRREQEARDRARHEAVKQQLAAMSVQGARRDVTITMYSTSWCGVCKMARDYMLEKNIPFTEHDVEQDETARTQARALNPRGSVPTISVDGDIMIGFAPAWLEGRIDRAAKRRATR